jgi:hypothetical protein
VINVTAQMTGQIDASGVVTPLAIWTARHGQRFALPSRGRAEIVCGQTTFVISSTLSPEWVPRSGHVWQWREQKYTVWSGLAMLLLVLMGSFVPPDPRALSFDRISARLRAADFVVTPPEQTPLPFAGERGETSGPARAAGESSSTPGKTARARERRFALPRAPDRPQPRTAQQRADEIRRTGILGLLRPDVGSPLAAILGGSSAHGMAGEAALEDLIASTDGQAYAIDDLVGRGDPGQGGTGDGLRSVGHLGTIDSRGDPTAAGTGLGRPGELRRRPPKAPDYVVGEAAVRGALDKEIVRRIIRRHINEVKYCYDAELARQHDLAGRIAITFTIGANGTVPSALVESTTMNNARVEGCLVGAVRRWEFPKPQGGGLVIATYPFTFMAP